MNLIKETNWYEAFLQWIEGTNLFRLIRDNPYAERIEGITPKEQFSLQRVKGIKIEKATDLPFPVITNFLQHYMQHLRDHPEDGFPARKFLTEQDNDIKLKVLKLMLNDGLIVQDVIDVIIEANGVVGVGLITLGETLDEYCKSKIRKT